MKVFRTRLAFSNAPCVWCTVWASPVYLCQASPPWHGVRSTTCSMASPRSRTGSFTASQPRSWTRQRTRRTRCTGRSKCWCMTWPAHRRWPTAPPSSCPAAGHWSTHATTRCSTSSASCSGLASPRQTTIRRTARRSRCASAAASGRRSAATRWAAACTNFPTACRPSATSASAPSSAPPKRARRRTPGWAR